MPNPACTIGGSATPQDVAASSSISGALASPAGAVFWGVTCIGTDETTTSAAINATLTVNNTLKTFSFTSQGNGTAYIFQSTVGVGNLSSQGAGRDANNVIQPSYTTTFKVNVPTSTGLRVVAQNEQLEQGSYGWIAEVNEAARTASANSGASQTTNTLVNGLNSNIATGGNTTLRFGGPTAAFSIGGFALAGSATPGSGQVIVVVNTTTQPMTIVNADASTTAKYRIDTQSGLAVTLLSRKTSALFMYDGTTNLWVLQNAAPLTSNTTFLGNALSWSVNPLYTGMASFVTGLSVPCAVGAVMHVGRPPTWPPGVGLMAIATAANTVTLEAVNNTGSTQTLPTTSGDIFTIAVNQ
jgi:hypothetical protein